LIGIINGQRPPPHDDQYRSIVNNPGRAAALTMWPEPVVRFLENRGIRVVIAVICVRMMQMSRAEIVHMIAVGNGFMSEPTLHAYA
jgi:hypothetical protein